MRLSTYGMKRADLDLNLGKLSVVIAPNAAGKSQIGDAISFAALGYIARLQHTDAATGLVLRDREMTVELSLDPRRSIKRTLELTDIGYRQRVVASWVDSRKMSEHAAAVLALFGTDEREVAETLWIEGLLRATTASQRAERLQALLGAAADPRKLAWRAARYTMQRLCAVDESRMPADHRELKPLLMATAAGQLQYAALSEAVTMLVAKLSETDCLGAIAWVNEEKRRAAAAVRPKAQARLEYADRLAALPPENPAELARLDALRADCEQRQGAAKERESTIESRRTMAADAARGLSVAETALRVAEDERCTFVEQLDGMRERAGRLVAVETALRELAAPAVGDDADAAALGAEAEHLEQDATGMLLPEVPDTGLLEARVVDYRRRLERAEASDWAAVLKIAADLEKFPVRLSSPVAKVKDYAKALRELAQRALGDDDPVQLRERLSQSETELSDARRELESRVAARRQATSRQQDTLREAREKREQATQLRARLRRQYEDAGAEYLRKKRALEIEAATLRQALRALEERDNRTREALAASTAELRSARQRIADLGPVPELESALDLSDEQGRIAAELQALQAITARRRDLERLVAELEQLDARHVVYDALERALRRVNDEEITRQAAPLLEPVARFLEAAGLSERPYLQGAELGWRKKDGKEVSIYAVSNSEWTLLSAALAITIASLRSAEAKVVCVEAEACDSAMLGALLRGVPVITEGKGITVVVLTPPCPGVVIPPVWALVELGGARAAAA